MGSILSMLIGLITIMYSIQKMEVLMSKKDVDILSTIKESCFDESKIFDHEDRFNVAVAFTAYDNEREWILDPSYGSLIFYDYSWGPSSDEDDETWFS